MDKECRYAAYRMIVAKNHPIIHKILFPYINRCVRKVSALFNDRKISLKGLPIISLIFLHITTLPYYQSALLLFVISPVLYSYV